MKIQTPIIAYWHVRLKHLVPLLGLDWTTVDITLFSGLHMSISERHAFYHFLKLHKRS
jgi:hypothetical protein